MKLNLNGTFGRNEHRALENKTMNLFRFGKSATNTPGTSFQTTAIGLAAMAICSVVSGCGIGISGGAASGSSTGIAAINTVKATGSVHGGQQPVTGASVQLYTVGTASLKSGSTPLLTQTVTTSDGSGTGGNASNAFNTLAAGGFTITGDYSCASATQVYIVATGGNSGGGTNSSISLVAALGSCASLIANPSAFLQINEVTTIAAAYALAPFAADLTHIGAQGSNPAGLVGAFANAALLVNVSSGSAPGAGLATGVTVPTTQINTLANIIAACINTSSAAPGNCTALQTATSASETFGAALAMARNPGSSAILGLYNMTSAVSPFQPYMTTAPTDFTIAVTTTASGSLATPYGVAVDASGDAWVTNETGTAVTEISPAGSALANPTVTGLTGAQGIAIDRSGNVWVANTAGNSVVKFALTNGSVSATSNFTSGGISAPTAIALDSAGNAFIANYNGNSVTGLTPTGAALANSPFTGSSNITVPQGITLDASGNIYTTSGQGAVVKLTNAGAYVSSFTDGTLQGPSALAVDSARHILATGFTTGTALGGALSEFNSAGVAASISPVTASLSTPSGVASDGTSIWVTNGVPAGCLAQYSYGASTSTSPSTGLGSLNTPAAVAIDATGSVWTTNSGSNTVSKFIGLAAPVTTPVAYNVGP